MTEYVELTTTQVLAGDVDNPINNVYRYKTPSTVNEPNSYAAALVDAFLTYPIVGLVTTASLADKINAVQSTDLANIAVSARNLYNPLDFVDVTWAGGGTTPEESLPAMMAVSFRGSRKRTGRNRWRKRLSGFPEALTQGDIITGSQTFLDRLTELAAAFETVIEGTAVSELRAFTPIVLYNERVTTPNGTGYRLPLTALEADGLHEVVDGVQWSNRLASQTSRRATPNYQ